MWEAIAELFNKESRRNMTVKQLRNLFSRVMEDFDDGYDEDESSDEEDDDFVVHDMVLANRRARGQVERDIIKDTMPM